MKRRILFINNSAKPARGGAGCIIDLAARLDRQKFDSVMLFPCPGYLSERLSKMGVRTLFLGGSEKYSYQDIFRVLGVVRGEKIDIVHANTIDSFFAGLAAKLSGRRLISHIHEELHKTWRWKMVGAHLLRLADCSVIDSRELAGRYADLIPESKIKVIYNGVDTEKFKPDPVRRQKARKSLGLNDSETAVLNVGYICPAKGHDHLLKAAAGIRKKHPEVRFIFAGDRVPEFPDFQRRLDEFVRQNDLEPVVTFLGMRQDVPELLSAADIFAHVSLKESFSIAILEAMASGKSIVATKVGGIAEQIEDGKSGLIVPPADSDALGTSLEKLLSMPEKAREFGENALRRVKEKFDIAIMVKNFEKLYGEILK